MENYDLLKMFLLGLAIVVIAFAWFIVLALDKHSRKIEKGSTRD